MRKLALVFLATLFSLTLAGCASELSNNSYNASEVGAVSQVEPGRIVSMQRVNINNNSQMGGLAGAVAGGAAGSMLGGTGAVNVMGAVGGAVVGGLIGNSVDQNVNRRNGTQYIVKLRNHQTISVVEPGMPHFGIHQPVLVLFGDGRRQRTRIVADQGSGVPAAY